jgi:hypothetical protein
MQSRASISDAELCCDATSLNMRQQLYDRKIVTSRRGKQ